MRLTDRWLNGLADDDMGLTAHLHVRDELNEFRVSGKYRYVIEITYSFEGTNLDPLPTDTAHIEIVDERLQEAMERDKMAILGASILEPGRKVWLYVSRTYEPFFDRLEEALEDLPLLPLQFEVVQDTDWCYYQELLDKLQQ